MSAIGSFHLISDSKRPALVAAAEAQAKALRRRCFGLLPPKLPLAPDPLWDYLRTHARELEEFPFSGDLLLEVALLVPSALGSQDSLGKDLSRIVQSTFVSFTPQAAGQAAAALQSADFSEGTIEAYLAGEGREQEFPDLVAPIRQSAEHLKGWLAAVFDGHTGILAIG